MSLQGFLRRRLVHFVLARSSDGRSPDRRLPLPPKSLRAAGDLFLSDGIFVESALAEASRVRAAADPHGSIDVLELGCGAGRLAIGLLEANLPIRRYIGLDVRTPAIEWCSRHLSSSDPRFQFRRVATPNARYNPPRKQGSLFLPALPIASSTPFDVAYAFSVFSHMTPGEVQHHLREFARLLRPEGAALFTAFVEKDVPNWTENPADYGPVAWSGPLHCVRYSRSFIEQLILQSGLYVEEFSHCSDTDGQSFFRCRLV